LLKLITDQDLIPDFFVEYSNAYAIVRMKLFYSLIIAAHILFLFIFSKSCNFFAANQ